MNTVQYHHEMMPRCQEGDKITQKDLNRRGKSYQDHRACLRKLKENLQKLSFFDVDFKILDFLICGFIVIFPVGLPPWGLRGGGGHKRFLGCF